MNTRKGRKQVLTAVSDQDHLIENNDQQQQKDNMGNNSSNNNKNNILRAFLETWLNTKRDIGKAMSATDEELYEEISKRLIDKGYAVSSKLVKHKISSFVKKYQYVQKCEREGKKIEWCNYDIVRQIFDLDKNPHTTTGTVVIPRQNIKSEDELDICDDQIMGDFLTNNNKNGTNDTTTTAQTQTFKEERVELIEIPDEDTYTQKNKRKNEKDDEDDSDDSEEEEELDEDLNFENPLDSIPLKLPNGTTVELERPKPTTTTTSEPLQKKHKNESSSMPQLRTVPNIKPSNTLTSQPCTIPGLKKDEFLIPTVNNVTGQPQFLVVKRLDPNAAAQKTTAPPLLKTAPNVSLPLQVKTVSTPPPPQLPPLSSSPTVVETTISKSPKHSPNLQQPAGIPRKNKYLGQGLSDFPKQSTLLTKIVELQEKIVAQEEVRIEMDRARMERDHEFQMEMLEIFKGIRDKLQPSKASKEKDKVSDKKN